MIVLPTLETWRKISLLQTRVDPLELFVSEFSKILPSNPRMVSGANFRGYRYDDPSVKHFCLIKMARCVSGINAMIQLARAGYAQEIPIILRALAESLSHIQWVLLPQESDVAERASDRFVAAYFSDSERGGAGSSKKPQIRQEEVHKAVGKKLDRAPNATEIMARSNAIEAHELMSNVYMNFSNYVHARYPEMMDMYGGKPGRYHLRGMSGTPKDGENIDMINAYIDTVSLTCCTVISGLELQGMIKGNPALNSWYETLGFRV